MWRTQVVWSGSVDLPGCPALVGQECPTHTEVSGIVVETARAALQPPFNFSPRRSGPGSHLTNSVSRHRIFLSSTPFCGPSCCGLMPSAFVFFCGDPGRPRAEAPSTGSGQAPSQKCRKGGWAPNAKKRNADPSTVKIVRVAE